MAIRASVNSKNTVRRKLALVIGIGNYDIGENLPNAIKDAKDMSSALRSIGFSIYENRPQLNLTHDEMSYACDTFKRSIDAGDMVLFYFAGHGKQWEDQNYLIPSNDFRKNDQKKVALSGPDLIEHATNAQHFLQQITNQNPFVIIFFLDCCRLYHLRNKHLIYHDADEQGNHSGRLRSLPTNPGSVISNARSMTANPRPMIANAGSLIAFACAPGTTADDGIEGEKNGLFTKYILEHILKPNEDIRMMLTDVTDGVIKESKSTQIPYVNSALRHKNICLYEQVTESPRTKSQDSQQQRAGVGHNYGNVSVLGGVRNFASLYPEVAALRENYDCDYVHGDHASRTGYAKTYAAIAYAHPNILPLPDFVGDEDPP